MHSQKDDPNSFFIKRCEMTRRNQINRREEIFNQTRKIFNQSENLQQKSQNKSEIQQSGPISHDITTQMQANQPHSNQKINQQKKGHPKRGKQRGKKKRQYYKNFQFPEWLVHIPHNLLQFYFCIRPAGERVFLNIKKNKVQVISMYGVIVKTLQIIKNSYQKTLLEGYYLKDNNMILISDLLVWKQNPMSSSEFQFRAAWLMSNFSQTVIDSLFGSQKIKIRLMHYFPLNKQNLAHVYSHLKHLQYQTDGILFYGKDSLYLHQTNPGVLLWKDPSCAPILKDPSLSQLILQHGSIDYNCEENIQFQMGSMSVQTNQQSECQQSLCSLSLQQKILRFYGQLHQDDGIVYTYDGIPLKRICQDDISKLAGHNHSTHSRWVVKFSFQQFCQRFSEQKTNEILNYIYISSQAKKCQDLNHEQSESLTQKFILNDFPYDLVHFRVLSLHQLNTRIPDSLSKIIFKNQYHSKGTALKIQHLIQKLEKPQILDQTLIITSPQEIYAQKNDMKPE